MDIVHVATHNSSNPPRLPPPFLPSSPPHLVQVCKGLIILYHHLRELCPLLWVDPHHVAEEEHVVRSVADLLGVEDDLLELASLSKALDHLQQGGGEGEGEG